MSRYLGTLALCAAALALAGCTTAIEGSASPNPVVASQIQEERTPLTARDAFGDLTTIDYCSLFDAQVAKDAGLSNATEPVSSYDDCYVEGQLDGQKIDLEIGFLERTSSSARMPDPTKELPRGLVAKRQLGDGYGNCSYYLSFPDGIDLDIYSYLDSSATGDAGHGGLCSLSSDLLNGVVTAVTRKKVTHLTFAPGSLGTVDACTLIPESLVRDQSGLPLPREENPSKHRCRWVNTGIGARASLWFYIDKPPQGTSRTTTETIGNRPSTVTPTTPTFCVVDTVLGPAPGAKNGQVEVAEAYLNLGNVGGKDPCAITRALAAQAWPQLPSN